MSRFSKTLQIKERDKKAEIFAIAKIIMPVFERIFCFVIKAFQVP